MHIRQVNRRAKFNFRYDGGSSTRHAIWQPRNLVECIAICTDRQTERHKDRKADRQTNKENDFNFDQFGIEDCAQHNNIPCQVQLLLHAWIKPGFMCSCPSALYLSLCYLCCCLMALRLTHKLTSDREHEHTWNWDVLVPIALSHPVSSGHKHKPQGSNVLYIQPWKTNNNIETTLIDGLIQFVGCPSHLPLSYSLSLSLFESSASQQVIQCIV